MFKYIYIFLFLFFIVFFLFISFSQEGLNNLEENSAFETSNTVEKQKNQYSIFIDVEDSKLFLLQSKTLIKKFSCAGGKYSTPSPIGFWKIITKDTWGEGFGGRWMGLNVPWGKFGIHGTIYPNSIGWASSKGCIRMRNNDIKELYKIVPHGTKVIITNGCYGPFGQGLRSLDPGEYGSDVMELQKKLQELGYYNGYVDGKYGDGMKSAVHRYQKDNNLPINNKISIKMINMLGFYEFE